MVSGRCFGPSRPIDIDGLTPARVRSLAFELRSFSRRYSPMVVGLRLVPKVSAARHAMSRGRHG